MKTGKRFALTDVLVIDGNGGRPIPNQAIIINEDRIEKVCPAEEIKNDSVADVPAGDNAPQDDSAEDIEDAPLVDFGDADDNE